MDTPTKRTMTAATATTTTATAAVAAVSDPALDSSSSSAPSTLQKNLFSNRALSSTSLLSSPAAASIKRSNSTSSSSSAHSPAALCGGGGGGGGCGGDRFIPARSAMDLELAHFQLFKENSNPQHAGSGREEQHKHNQQQHQQQNSNSVNHSASEVVAAASASPARKAYQQQLAGTCCGGGVGVGGVGGAKILAFKSKAPKPSEFDNPLQGIYCSNALGGQAPRNSRHARHIPAAPERILDAPDLVDDYYLNLLDWNKDNVISVALGSTVYLWNASSGEIQELCQTQHDDNVITSVSWHPDSNFIGIGTNFSEVQIWDTQAQRQVRSMKNSHIARVGSLAWNDHLLTSGSRDTSIVNHDVRIRDPIVSKLEGHTQEVCGLKWSLSGQQLASGGNDNLLHIWDKASCTGSGSGGRAPRFRHRLDGHLAAVKALAWCPFQANLLASGGGTADRCIRFWNTHTGALVNSIDTHSQCMEIPIKQVCSLQWSQHEREILSSHGYSQNQLCLWKYPSMAKIAELTGHSARVLHLAQSPDGTTVCSAAADETLRFWKVFGGPDTARSQKKAIGGMSALRTMSIR